MNTAQRKILDQLEAMSIKEARTAIANGQFGDVNSPNHELAMSWLSSKESEAQEDREKESLSIANDANLIANRAFRAVKYDRIIAITAIIIAAIAAREDIKWLVNVIINSITS